MISRQWKAQSDNLSVQKNWEMTTDSNLQLR